MEKSNVLKLAEETRKLVSPGNENNVQVSIRVNRKPLNKMPPNIMVLQAFAKLAAMKLKPVTNRVLMFFFGLSAYENFLGIDIKTIAETLEITERSVITALRELEHEKIIIKLKHGIDKRRNDYFLNPLAAWKGNSFTREKRIKELMKNDKQLALFASDK